MNYLNDVEQQLRRRLGESDEPGYAEWVDDIVAFVREKLLESYKNGAAAERNRRQGKSNIKKGAKK
jgi:hypothetical protein